MAEYRWKIDLKKKYLIKVNWRFSGIAELTLNRKKIVEADSRTFSHSFLLDGTACTVRFENEEVVVNHSKLPIWAPQLYLNDNKIKPS